jgi:hypothetical protein
VVKQQGRETDYSPAYSAKVMNSWSNTSTPPHTTSWHDAQLKHRGNFTFTSYSELSELQGRYRRRGEEKNSYSDGNRIPAVQLVASHF